MSTDQRQPIDPDQGFRLEPQFPDEPSEFESAASEAQLMRGEDIPLSAEAVTVAGMMGRVMAKLETEMQRLAAAGIAVAQSVSGINPTDQSSYAILCERLVECKKFYEGVEAWADPWRELFYRPYKAVLERVTTINQAPIVAYQNGKNRRLAFEREVAAAAERERQRLAAEQKQREEEQRLANAVTAEQLGMSEQAVETILTAPSVAPAPQPAPMITRPQGVRKIPPNWQAELVSEEDFWKWARTQKKIPPCIRAGMDACQVVLNREAKSHRALLGQVFPGWRGVNKGGD